MGSSLICRNCAIPIGQQRLVAARDGASANNREASWLQKLGDPGLVLSTGSELQQGLIRASAKAYASNLDVHDALIERQTQRSLASVSYRALSQQLGESNIGRRILNVASAFLHVGCVLWSIFFRMVFATATPVLCVFKLRYDETPSKIRVQEARDTTIDVATADPLELAKVGCESSAVPPNFTKLHRLAGHLPHTQPCPTAPRPAAAAPRHAPATPRRNYTATPPPHPCRNHTPPPPPPHTPTTPLPYQPL